MRLYYNEPRLEIIILSARESVVTTSGGTWKENTTAIGGGTTDSDTFENIFGTQW